MKILFDICLEYFKGDETISEWQVDSLKSSKKGDFTNPDNWKDIKLLYVVSKVMSLVIAVRLQVVFEKTRYTTTIWSYSRNRMYIHIFLADDIAPNA